jgi:hypothetical protein
VRRFFAWLAGFVGGAAAYGFFRRRPAPDRGIEADPAEALKAKLAEARASGDERTELDEREPTVDEAPDVDARRRSVHEEARAAIDEMQRD